MKSSCGVPGLLGRLIGHIMAAETAAANTEALTLLDLRPSDRVLEVGSGHGRTLERAAAALTTGWVAGVDLSKEMVRLAALEASGFLCVHVTRTADGLVAVTAHRLPHRGGRASA